MNRQLKIDAWLAEHGGHCMWQRDLRHGTVECWAITGTTTTTVPLIIVCRYTSGGWDVFTSPSGSNRTDAFIEALNAQFGF